MPAKEEKIQYEECSDFTPGLITLDDPTNLPLGGSPYILNMDITKQGTMLTRYGYEEVCEVPGTAMRGGQTFYRTYGSNSNDYLLLFAFETPDVKAYYVTRTDMTTETLIGTVGTDNGLVTGTTFANYAIFGNGLAANDSKKWDGASMTNMTGAPDARAWAVFQKRLFATRVAVAPGTTYWTDVDNVDSWGSNFLTVNQGDGWDCTALVANNDALQVFKEDNINAMNFSFDSSYVLTLPNLQPIINSQGGAYAPLSAQPIYGYTYYLSSKGIESYGPSEERVTADAPLPLSLKIDPTIKTVNYAQKNNIASAFHDNKYLLAVPLGNETKNNWVIAYNENIKRRFGNDNFTIYTGLPVAQFVKFRDEYKRDQLYFVSHSEPKLFKFNTSFSDAGNGYDRLWRSRTFRYGERTHFKYLDIEGVKTEGSTIYVDLTTDDYTVSGTETITLNITDENFITAGAGGGLVGFGDVGGTYVGSIEEAATTPLYKYKKRIYFPETVNFGYTMYFQIRNNAVDEGWGLSRYLLAYQFDPEEPSYSRTE